MVLFIVVVVVYDVINKSFILLFYFNGYSGNCSLKNYNSGHDDDDEIKRQA